VSHASILLIKSNPIVACTTTSA